MIRISKIIRIISAILKNPSLLNLVLTDEVYLRRAEKLKIKKGFPIIDLIEMFPDFNEQINYFSSLDGGSLIIDYAILKKIVSNYKNANYFEIGTWRGESVSNVSEVATHCYTFNLSNEQLRELGMREEYVIQQDLYSKNIKNIIHLKGNSLKFNFSRFYKKFDVVFIDGDHHYDSVKNDTEVAFKLIKNEKSTILWHDYGFTPEKIRNEVMCAIFEGTPKKYRSKLYHISNSLCAIYTQEKYLSSSFDDLLFPSKNFKVEISAYGMEEKKL